MSTPNYEVTRIKDYDYRQDVLLAWLAQRFSDYQDSEGRVDVKVKVGPSPSECCMLP